MRPTTVVLAFVAVLSGGACTAQRMASEPAAIVATDEPRRGNVFGAFAGGTIEDIRPAQRPHISSDEAGLWMIFDRLERRVKKSGNLIHDPRVTGYVKRVAGKLAGPYCGDIRVYVVRRPGFNATMAPNGMMTVWSGLLLRVRNEAQLAAVVGHEVGHYLRRHSVQRFRDVRAKSGLMVFMSMAMGVAGVGAAADIARLAVIGSVYAFGRDNEREADSLGVRLIAEAGYDPREAAMVWDNLIREHEADKDRQRPSIFFSSHPTSEERRDTLKKIAEDAVATGLPGRSYQARHRAAVGPVRAVLLRDELRIRRPKSAETLLEMLAEDDFAPAETLFFQGEMYRLRNEEGDRDKAIAAYERAIAAVGAPPEAHRSLGILHLKGGDGAAARAALTKYLELRPEADDRAIILNMLSPLTG
jgi:predicted Zn-dependent protease